MALEFGFYDSYDHDRLYNAEQMNSIFEGVITDGVYAGVGNHFAVHPGIGLQVTVDTGRAWFKMTWNKNRTLTPLYLDMADPVYNRIDTICIRVRKGLDYRSNDFYVYRGSITSSPEPPTIKDGSDTFYLPLANVTVRANAESISDADIEMLVGKTRCPFVTSILQQTDISDLFKQWEGQFVEWWDGVRHILDLIEGGNIGEIFSEIDKKVNRADKATSEDVRLNSDSKWMTPMRTKEMLDDAVESVVGDSLKNVEQSIQEVNDKIKNGVVTSFKGRTGAVTPASGDYTAAQVGALSVDGGTVKGELTVLAGGSSNSSAQAFRVRSSGSPYSDSQSVVQIDAALNSTTVSYFGNTMNISAPGVYFFKNQVYDKSIHAGLSVLYDGAGVPNGFDITAEKLMQGRDPVFGWNFKKRTGNRSIGISQSKTSANSVVSWMDLSDVSALLLFVRNSSSGTIYHPTIVPIDMIGNTYKVLLAEEYYISSSGTSIAIVSLQCSFDVSSGMSSAEIRCDARLNGSVSLYGSAEKTYTFFAYTI